jgi:hypothetical protein
MLRITTGSTRTRKGLAPGRSGREGGRARGGLGGQFSGRRIIEHCATQGVPLDISSPGICIPIRRRRTRQCRQATRAPGEIPQLKDVKLFISEWNMDLMRPNLAPGFQPCFVLETMRRYAEEKLDMAAYYHIRDCFVDPADFDWMSPGGRRFMAHWWNTMPQYSALFDHHGRVRPAWYAFRLLGQLEGPALRR